jgi:spermidine/putrescine transport system permease protein
LSAPLGLLVVFLAAPALTLLLYSFWKGGFFQVVRELTLANYVTALTSSEYRVVTWNALGIGLSTAVITTLLSYGLAYTLVFKLTRGRNVVLYLIVLSVLSGYLMRIYAWRIILGRTGLLNGLLLELGLVEDPLLGLAFSRAAVIVALVNIFIPFAVLPILSALSNIPRELIEAARDLGDGPARAFWRVTLPLSLSGVFSAFTYTLILASGDYITPELLGGVSGSMIGRSIALQFVSAGNPPLGAALSFVLLGVYALIFLGLHTLLRRLSPAAVR